MYNNSKIRVEPVGTWDEKTKTTIVKSFEITEEFYSESHGTGYNRYRCTTEQAQVIILSMILEKMK